VIFTHSHIDHFGGVLSLINGQQAAVNNVPIIAPSGFMEEATSENVIAGPAMTRRGTYMFGNSPVALCHRPCGCWAGQTGRSMAALPFFSQRY
jgi:alkyl sulfatase BDS1-like metallo-beta-lactamase superfamily hydrolase